MFDRLMRTMKTTRGIAEQAAVLAVVAAASRTDPDFWEWHRIADVLDEVGSARSVLEALAEIPQGCSSESGSSHWWGVNASRCLPWVGVARFGLGGCGAGSCRRRCR